MASLPFGTAAPAGFVAAYLLVRGGEAAVVDTDWDWGAAPWSGSTARGVILAAPEAAGLGYADLAHVILTHWHQDHAGGAPAVMAAALNVRAHAGAADIPLILTNFSGVRPVPVQDGDRVFSLRIVTTPGHTPGGGRAVRNGEACPRRSRTGRPVDRD